MKIHTSIFDLILIILLLGTSQSTDINCSKYESISIKNEPIDSIVCLDDGSAHVPLHIQNLPKGLSFDGKTISGSITENIVRQPVVVYNRDTSVIILFSVWCSDVTIDYGRYLQKLYNNVLIDPIIPKISCLPDYFIISPDIITGLHFDNITGIISGTPSVSGRPKPILFHITAISKNSTLSSASLILHVLNRERYENRGAQLCIQDTDHAFDISDLSLFASSFSLHCHSVSSLSWTNDYDPLTSHHLNPFMITPTAYLRFSTYYETYYNTPTTFILTTMNAVSVYIDEYKHPLLESYATSNIQTRQGTIMLKRGLHHIVVVVSTYSKVNYKSYFKLSYALHCYEQYAFIFMKDNLVLPLQPPIYYNTNQYIDGRIYQKIYSQFETWNEGTELIQRLPNNKIINLDYHHFMVYSQIPEMITGSWRLSNEGGQSDIDLNILIGDELEGLMISISEGDDLTEAELLTHYPIWNKKRHVLQQQFSPSLEEFTIMSVVEDIRLPLIEYNATMILLEPGSFTIQTDDQCEIFLNNELLQPLQYYTRHNDYEEIDFYMRCIDITFFHNITLLPSVDHTFYAPYALHDYTSSIVHGFINQTYTIDPLYSTSLCSIDTPIEGITLDDNCSIHILSTTSISPTTLYYTLNNTLHGSIDLTIVEPLSKPSAITLHINDIVIYDTLTLTLGESFTITITVDPPEGTQLFISPPLPSTLHLTSHFITGKVYEPLEGIFTINAINSQGSCARLLYLSTDATSSGYAIQSIQGRIKLTIVEPLTSRVVVLSPNESAALDTTQGLIQISAYCYSYDGCFYRLSNHTWITSSIYLHYDETRNQDFALPMNSLQITNSPLTVTCLLNHQIPSIYWDIQGFYQYNVTFSTPGLSYNAIENKIEGIAEEEGEYTESIVFYNETISYEYSITINIIDEMNIASNNTYIEIITINEQHSPNLLNFTYFNSSFTFDLIPSSSISCKTLIQSLFLPYDTYSLVLPTLNTQRVELYINSNLIASRKPSSYQLWFRIESLIAISDELLFYNDLDPISSSWMNRHYDDGFWLPIIQGVLDNSNEPMYIRKHFDYNDIQMKAIALEVTITSGIEVYLNSQLIWTIHVNQGCDSYCTIMSTHRYLKPTIHQMVINSHLDDFDNVLAIKIYPSYPYVLQSFYFSCSITAFSSSSSLITSSSTSITTSPCILSPVADPKLLLSPFTTYAFYSSQLPFTISIDFHNPTSLSQILLFSSRQNLFQPIYIDITGESVTHQPIALTTIHHPLLWTHPTSPYTVNLDTATTLHSLTFTIYDNEYIDNPYSYIGAIELYSAVQYYCPEDDGFPRTLAGTKAYLPVYNTNEKGLLIRECIQVVDEATNTTKGEWKDKDVSHVVQRKPRAHHAFVEFMYLITRISKEASYDYVMTDLETVVLQALNKKQYITAIHTYDVSDSSRSKSSKFLFKLQIQCKAKHAHTVAKLVANGDHAVSWKLLELSEYKYGDLEAFGLNFKPLVIIGEITLLEKIIIISLIIIVMAGITYLIYYYRHSIKRRYNYICTAYRLKRRKEVCDEMGIPYNLTFLPKQNEVNADARTFETPYGDIHLVKPLLPQIEDEPTDFIQATTITM